MSPEDREHLLEFLPALLCVLVLLLFMFATGGPR